MAKKGRLRKLKWVGEPPILQGDGWRVGNWSWENSRLIALVGFCWLRISPETLPGLSRAYTWGLDAKGNVSPDPNHMITEVDPIDAELILQHQSHQIIDVTEHPAPLSVKNEPIIVTQGADGKFYRSR